MVNIENSAKNSWRKKIIFILSIALSIFYNVVAQKPTYAREIEYLRTHGKNPTEYILGKFATYDLVMLGEDHAIKEDLEFVESLIPHLYKAGVYNLCMEFGASEMQARLDSLINAPQYNESVARDMMYFYNVGWAYKEYTDIYKAAWAFNKSLPAKAKKFRIVNLSYQFNWSAYKGRTPENMAKVFYKGTFDKYRKERIEQEILGKKEKALVYVGYPHAFTKFKLGLLDMDNDSFCDYDDGCLGNRLYKKYPDKVFSIMLHCAFFSRPDQLPRFVSPANGAIEYIMKALKYEPVGFDLIHSPLGDLSDSSTFSQGYKKFTIGQLFDGYIFLEPFNQMHGCTIDTLFFEHKSWAETKRQMPDPNWFVAQNMDAYWKKIKSYVAMRQRYKDLTDSTMPRSTWGRIIRFKNFPSRYVQPRNVDVWLPKDYSDSKKYVTLYMNDGQMLFDSTITWNHKAWHVDKHLSKLMTSGTIKNCIVIGIWNTAHRFNEYFPQDAINYLSGAARNSLLENPAFQGKLLADNYLKFIVKELKPSIDSTFSTLKGSNNTFMAGSSMGGLISMYALCKYPDVFGGAACLSTHWPGVIDPKDEEIPNAILSYMKANIPPAQTHKFYFDHGTEGLDSHYTPYQLKVDKLMRIKGYTGKNYMTKVFDGANHSETSWDKRFDIPAIFLMKQ